MLAWSVPTCSRRLHVPGRGSEGVGPRAERIAFVAIAGLSFAGIVYLFMWIEVLPHAYLNGPLVCGLLWAPGVLLPLWRWRQPFRGKVL